MAILLDANVLVALIVTDHVHHAAAETWLASTSESFATCPDVAVDGVVGHRQVTDAYLAQLARSNHSKLATFDRGLAALPGDVAEFIDPAR